MTTTTTLTTITADLSKSLRRPGRRTLALIDRALGWLRPFESPLARTASAGERDELLALIDTYRQVLSPYMDVDRAEANLRMS